MTATGVAALIGLAAIQTSAPPLAPSSAWSIDYGEAKCTLSRSFGPKDQTVTLGLQPAIAEGLATIVLLVPKTTKLASGYGNGEIEVSPDRTVKMQYESQPVPGLDQMVVRVYVEDTLVDTIFAVPALRIKVGRTPLPAIAVTGAGKALTALATCRTKLMVAWGVDPAIWAKATVRAEAIGPEDWIGFNDYPADALRENRQGETAMLWKIGTNGRVSDCRIVKSSGTPSLDIASCAAMTKHGVYRPARDASGRPIVSWGSKSVQWRLPMN